MMPFNIVSQTNDIRLLRRKIKAPQLGVDPELIPFRMVHGGPATEHLHTPGPKHVHRRIDL